MPTSSPAELSAPNLAEPLTPPDCDLRSTGMAFMPLDVGRLMDSDLFAIATGEEFKAAMALYAKSWLQCPAGSLPNNERVLAHLAGGYAPRRWARIRDVALHGWMLCTDGRLYHPMVAELANDAWEKSRHTLNDAVPTRRVSSAAERMRRYRQRQKAASASVSPDQPAWTAAHCAPVGDGVTVTPTVTAQGVTRSVTRYAIEKEKENKSVTEKIDRSSPVTPTVTVQAVTQAVTQEPVTVPTAPCQQPASEEESTPARLAEDPRRSETSAAAAREQQGERDLLSRPSAVTPTVTPTHTLANDDASLDAQVVRPAHNRSALSGGEVCKAMRSAGLAVTNPNHPMLLDLIKDGVALEQFIDGAEEAVRRNAKFAYALTVVESRHKKNLSRRAGADAAPFVVNGSLAPAAAPPQRFSKFAGQSISSLSSLRTRMQVNEAGEVS